MNRLGKCGKLPVQRSCNDRSAAVALEYDPGGGMVDMTPEDEWDAIRSRRAPLFGAAGMSMLRIVLLFGSAAVALALILAPMADRYSKTEIVGAQGLDFDATGSVGRPGGYTIRRSVLQAPGAVCIIDSAGRRSGDC
jgi:hypothetical protein